MRLKTLDIGFIISLIIISVISIDFILNETHRNLIENISKYPPFQNLFSGILITFIVTLIGNLLPFPTPYTFVLCYSSLPFYNLHFGIPLLLALVASFGCLIGELGGYFVGRGSIKLISEKNKSNLSKYHQFLLEHPKFGPFFIFVAALTPISDDFVTIPLGMLKYSLKKTVFWCWLGKLGLMLVFAYNLFNICNLFGGESWILSIVSLYLIIILMYILLKIDLIELFIRFFKKRKMV